jgi:hypothetical protein
MIIDKENDQIKFVNNNLKIEHLIPKSINWYQKTYRLFNINFFQKIIFCLNKRFKKLEDRIRNSCGNNIVIEQFNYLV